MGIGKKIREILSEPGKDGTLSWGRVAACFTTLTAIGGFLYVVIHSHALPDGAATTGAAGFAVSPYVAAKAGAAAQSFSDNPVSNSSPKIDDK